VPVAHMQAFIDQNNVHAIWASFISSGI